MLAELTTQKLMTAEELWQLSPEERHGELIRGEFFAMSPAGHTHGSIGATLLILIGQYVRQHKLGKLYTAETGFILSRNPDTVRAPDAAFVTAERAAQQEKQSGFFDGAPDLAVEVISPSEKVDDIEEKLIDYLEAGVRLVWLVYPRTKTVAVYRSLTSAEILTANDTLDGGDVLPGFTTAVAEIFA